MKTGALLRRTAFMAKVVVNVVQIGFITTRKALTLLQYHYFDTSL
jgi:hypothetical protein